MTVYQLSKDLLNSFLLQIKKIYEVYAPQRRDIVRFELLDDNFVLDFSENSYFPIKEHFFRKQEVLFQFKGTKLIPIKQKIKKKIFFGVRRCDLNAIRNQDMVFIEQHNDPYYAQQRKQSILIGYHCTTAPSIYCFCESMNLTDFYDLMFFDRGSFFLIDVKTKKGEDFLNKYNYFFSKTNYLLTKEDCQITTRKLEKQVIASFYYHPDCM